jgi:hypothetical protein
MIPRNRWPEALKAFLADDQSVVTVEEIAVVAFRSPGGFPVEASALTWITQALAAMHWRQKGDVWRRR